MAFKGTASKSASGASMSKYDVEVEKRLKALEGKAHEQCNDGGSDPRVDTLIRAAQEAASADVGAEGKLSIFLGAISSL